MAATEMPRLFSSRPIEATVTPLPTDETTPPVTKMIFGKSVVRSIAPSLDRSICSLLTVNRPKDRTPTGRWAFSSVHRQHSSKTDVQLLDERSTRQTLD